MSQKIGQEHFNHQNGNSYASFVNNTSAIQVQSQDSGNNKISFSFADSGLRLTSGGSTYFNMNNNYYLHAIVKRLSSVQIFNIKLLQVDSTGKVNTNVPEQQIKRIEVVNKSENDKYVEVEIIFNPRGSDYNTISFELERKQGIDTGTTPRESIIAFVELSIINNKMPSELSSGISLSKIGVQSHPDLLMCINGEEIHMPRSGIFELRDGIIKVTFFSVVSAAILNDTTPLDDQLNNETAQTETFSTSNYAKTRYIDGYTLDYMYDSNT